MDVCLPDSQELFWLLPEETDGRLLFWTTDRDPLMDSPFEVDEVYSLRAGSDQVWFNVIDQLDRFKRASLMCRSSQIGPMAGAIDGHIKGDANLAKALLKILAVETGYVQKIKDVSSGIQRSIMREENRQANACHTNDRGDETR